MREHGHYPYRNPMLSDVLTGLRHEQQRGLANRGAPEQSGIRGASRLETMLQPTATFRDQRRQPWAANVLVSQPQVIDGLNAAFTAMEIEGRSRLSCPGVHRSD